MRKLSRPAHPVGLAPGTLKAPPSGAPARPRITLFDYDGATLEERTPERIEECFAAADGPSTTWINVDGIYDTPTIEALGEHFGLHPLMLEDVVTTAQRSKVEQYDGNTYIVIRMLRFDPARGEIDSEQVSLIITDNTLITLQEQVGDVFEAVRARLRAGRPRIRSAGPAYLAYTLLDAVVDHYFVLLEQIGGHLETIEDALVTDPRQETLHAIHRLKRELIFLRKSVWPLREAVAQMLRDEDLPFHEALRVYLRDLYDHTVHVIETIESYRDLNAGMLDTYLSVVGNRMNEIMKTLTIIATIFIPLTFIAGIYGMNFEHMPELHLKWAYPALWAVMVVITAFMLRFFRRRGWL